MEPYARALVMFLQALSAPDGAARYVEAFAFGTRLTRLTPHLAGARPRRGSTAPAWRCPTGAAAPASASRWPPTTACSAAAGSPAAPSVVIASDGWERGDLDAARPASWPRWHGRRDELIWVNPLKGHEGFEPLAGGMRTALRHVDDVWRATTWSPSRRWPRRCGGCTRSRAQSVAGPEPDPEHAADGGALELLDGIPAQGHDRGRQLQADHDGRSRQVACDATWSWAGS